MAEIKLGRLPDRTPVRLTLSISPGLHRSLSDYSEFYRETYAEPAPVPDLVPAMLESFLAGDKAFLRWTRERQGRED